MEKISQKIAKDIEKSWFRSRSQDFCQSLEGFGFREFGLRKNFGFGFLKFGLGKKVPVSENLVSEKKYRFWFWKIWSRQKSLGFGKFGIGKKVSVLVSVKFLVLPFSVIHTIVTILYHRAGLFNPEKFDLHFPFFCQY